MFTDEVLHHGNAGRIILDKEFNAPGPQLIFFPPEIPVFPDDHLRDTVKQNSS